MLNAITDQAFTGARRQGRHEPVEAYAFDALMAMAVHAARPDQPAALANGGAAPVTDRRAATLGSSETPAGR